ncbi:hypothetical protein V512_013115 [Mesotoga sp. Brook.08.105.5.1]|nr:hypothetical protein V512_013115 [Mesotoga sp. Brook.08.105.5.1]RAO96029.1 hypothetical protein M388_05885 [Mesotoga sp. Brook.08.YT.4.2.5.4.]
MKLCSENGEPITDNLSYSTCIMELATDAFLGGRWTVDG